LWDPRFLFVLFLRDFDFDFLFSYGFLFLVCDCTPASGISPEEAEETKVSKDWGSGMIDRCCSPIFS